MSRRIFNILKICILSLIISLSSASLCYASVDYKALQGYFNSVVAQEQINHSNNPKYADRSNSVETVDPVTGSLQLQQTDISLPGKDGLDLIIARNYNSAEDENDKCTVINKTGTRTSSGYFIYVTYESGYMVCIGPTNTDYASSSAICDSYKNLDGVVSAILVYEDYTEDILEKGNIFDKYSYNKTHYYLGAGWSFAFPSVQMEVDGNNTTYLYFHDGNGNSYKVNFTADENDSNLEGYQGKDVKFLSSGGEYINGTFCGYKFIDSNMTTTYFATSGGVGTVACIRDRFNNEINFKYKWYMIYDKGVPLISQITDSVGRIITFNYEGNDIIVTASSPDGSSQLSVTYKRLFITKNLNPSAGSPESYQYPVLDSVIDTEGQITKYVNYNENNACPTERFSFFTKDYNYSALSERYLIGAVIYPGSKTVYEYDKTTRNLGADGYTEAYRVKSRTDYIKRALKSDPSTFEWIDNNRVDYTYFGDYTGYPTYYKDADIPNTYQFGLTATAGDGLSTKYIFNGKKQLIQEESTASNNEKKVVKYLEFDNTYQFLPTKIESSQYTGNGTLAQALYTGKTYTGWGGISSVTSPLTSQQYNDINIKSKYTTTYSYEDATYQYFLTRKQWYQSDAILLSELYSYNSLGRVLNTTNSKNEITSYSYYKDTNNNDIVETTQNLGNGKNLKIKSVYGSETGYAYPREVINYYTNEQGTMTETKTSYGYNMLLGLVNNVTDNENKTTKYTYDNYGRVKAIQYPNFVNTAGENISVMQDYQYERGYYLAYSDDSNYNGINGITVTSYTSYKNNNTNLTYYYDQRKTIYDDFGNLRQEELWDGSNYIIKSNYKYDKLQRVISSCDALGNTVKQSYNAWGQANETTDASGNLYVSDYDLITNKAISYFVAKDNIPGYRSNTNDNTYKEDYVEVYLDQFGRATSRKVYENWPSYSGELSELYRYDIAGNLTGYTDPKRNLNEDGITTTYQYDALNRIAVVKDAQNQITNIDYTVLGNIAAVTLKANAASTSPITLYTKDYDELGNMISKTDPSAQATRYSYNSIGLNTKSVDRNGSTFTAAYDGLNQRKETFQISSDNLSSIGYKYNYNSPFGYSNEQLYTNGTYTTGNTYSYNAIGAIAQKNVDGTGYVNSNLKLQYDNAGRLNSVGAGVVDSNYYYSNYKYTGDRLTQVQTNGLQANSAVDTDNVTYEYYPDGKLKKITYPKLNDNTYLTTEYSYNTLGRMTSMTNKKGTTVLSQFAYTYDANGNIITVNDGQTTKSYVYDKLNRLIEIQPQTGGKTVYTYDLRGNRLTEINDNFNLNIENTSYSYDVENKLQTLTKGTSITNMKYYADGLRAKKETATGYTSYIYNLSGKLVAEAQNSSEVTSNYVWGPDRVLSKKVTGGGEYYYLYNGHGDVIQMVDRNGNVVNNYNYDEWGNILTSNETISNPFKYAGEIYDDETGLYYLRARYYDPTTGRFINEDPICDGFNWYSYCENNPLIYIDPSGLDSYILYDPNAVSGDGKHTFYDEALIRQDQLEEQYGTPAHIISTANATEFKDAWDNNVGYDEDGNPVSIDEVVIILHGTAATVKGTFKDIGYGFMYFTEGTRITTGKDITRDGDVGIWELKKKEIGTLYFSSCNSGNPDIVNVADKFEQYMYITDKIVAWDGGTIFNYATGELEMGAYGGWYKEWKRQPTYFRYVQKIGLYPLRKRMGEVIIYAHTWEAAS